MLTAHPVIDALVATLEHGPEGLDAVGGHGDPDVLADVVAHAVVTGWTNSERSPPSNCPVDGVHSSRLTNFARC